MFFWILIFDPKWLFWKGYSFCMMVDFQNRVISRLFDVFSSGFLHRTILTWLENRFSHICLNFNFWPKVTILQRLYSLCMMADLQNRLISLIFGVFSSGFLHRTTLTWLKNRCSHIFWILIFDPTWLFCKGYSLCVMADFQNRLISRMLGVFSSVFCTEQL